MFRRALRLVRVSSRPELGYVLVRTSSIIISRCCLRLGVFYPPLVHADSCASLEQSSYRKSKLFPLFFNFPPSREYYSIQLIIQIVRTTLCGNLNIWRSRDRGERSMKNSSVNDRIWNDSIDISIVPIYYSKREFDCSWMIPSLHISRTMFNQLTRSSLEPFYSFRGDDR